MKTRIEELSAAGTADVTAVTPKVMSNVIEEIRRHNKVWGQFYKENRDLMTNGGTQVEFPKKQTGIVSSWGMSPGNTITASKMSYDAVTIAIAKGGIGIGLQGEAIRQANRDVLADHITEAGMVWKDTLDLIAMEKMFPVGTIITSATSLQIAAGTFAIGIKATIGDFSGSTLHFYSTGFSISPIRAAATDATITFWYIPTATGSACNKRAVSTGVANGNLASISPKDIIKLKSDINGYGYNPEIIVMHPDMFAEVVYDPAVKYVESAAYTGAGVAYTGEIGKLWGIRVVTSYIMPAFGIAMIDPSKVGYEIVRKELDMKRDEYTGIAQDILYFWGFGERNWGVVNPKSYGAIYIQGTLAPGKWAVQGSAFEGINPQ